MCSLYFFDKLIRFLNPTPPAVQSHVVTNVQSASLEENIPQQHQEQQSHQKRHRQQSGNYLNFFPAGGNATNPSTLPAAKVSYRASVGNLLFDTITTSMSICGLVMRTQTRKRIRSANTRVHCSVLMTPPDPSLLWQSAVEKDRTKTSCGCPRVHCNGKLSLTSARIQTSRPKPIQTPAMLSATYCQPGLVLQRNPC